jgi:hypothetical protein
MEPRTHSLLLTCDAATAFEVFTSRMGEWWPPAYTPDPDAFETVLVAPQVGGDVLMRMRDGSTHRFGRVTTYVPGEVYAQTWTLAQPDEHPSLLTVTFSDRSHGSLVVLEHGGWHAGNEEYSEKFGDWPVILQRYAALVQAQSTGRH